MSFSGLCPRKPLSIEADTSEADTLPAIAVWVRHPVVAETSRAAAVPTGISLRSPAVGAKGKNGFVR
jgi:hypothetical protein